MESLSKDLILYLALKLDLKSLKNFSLISKRFNVLENKIFWRNKIDIERPNLLSLISSQFLKYKNYKSLYILLEKTKNSYNIFYDYSNLEIFGAIRGKININYHGIDYNQIDIIEHVPVGNEAWIFFQKKDDYYYQPKLFKSEESVMERAKDVLFFIWALENDNDLVEPYIEKFEKEKYVELYSVKLAIKKVTII